MVARVKRVVPAAGLLPPSHWLTCRWARVGSIFALSGHCAVHRVVRVCVPRSHRSCSCLAATRRRRVAAVQLPRCPRACRVAMAVWRWWWWCGRGGVAEAHRVTAARRFFEHAAWSAHLSPERHQCDTMPRCLCARATVARDHGTRTVLVVPAACSLAVDGDSTPMRVPPASQRDTHPHTSCTRPLAPPCAVWLARARGRLARRTASTRSGAVALAGPAWPLQGLGWCTQLNVVAAPGWRVCTEARRSFVRLRHRHPRHLRVGRHARTHVPVAQPP